MFKGKEQGAVRPKLTVYELCFSAVCIAAAMALSQIIVYHMPQGGSITACSMLFLALIGYRLGLAKGLVACSVYGMLSLILKPEVVGPWQLIMDYPLAFGMLGLSGLFKERKLGLVYGVIFGGLGRFVMHTASGAIFFAEYAGAQNPWIYSSGYNIMYMGPEIILTAIVAAIIPFNRLMKQFGDKI